MPDQSIEPLFDSQGLHYTELLAWLVGDYDCRSLSIDVRLEHSDEGMVPAYEVKAHGWLLYPNESESAIAMDYIGSGFDIETAAANVLGQIETWRSMNDE